MRLTNFNPSFALLSFSLVLTSCSGRVSVPAVSVISGTGALSSDEQLTLQAVKPHLTSDGTERIKISGPNLKVKLPRKGDPFLYGLEVTESLEAFYEAVHSSKMEKALQILDEAGNASEPLLMGYAVAMLRTQILIPTGQSERIEEALRILEEREVEAFGKNLESLSLRGEMHSWLGNLSEAKRQYEKVLAAIGNWRVPASYKRFPSNNNEVLYFGRAQLRAETGLAAVLIQERDYESALAWAVDSQKRFSEILKLAEHWLYGKYVKITPDLYTGYGWTLAFLGAARVGYSKNVQASEEIFQMAKDYFSVEGHMEGASTVDSILEYVLINAGLVEKPTERIGQLPEVPEKERANVLEKIKVEADLPQREEKISEWPASPKNFIRLPRAGEQSPFGFKVTPEYEAAFQAYLKGDGEEALSRLDRALLDEMEPASAWSLSYLRAQVLMMMGRAADAEAELEKTAEWESRAFGTNINTRSLRGEARTWLADYDNALVDFFQVIQALGGWKLPTTYAFAPADVSQLALRSRAQLRAYVGLATVFILQRNYGAALKWSRASERLFEDLYQVLHHPLYQNYIALDPDMVYGRGLNLGILAASHLVLRKDKQASGPVFDTAKNYFAALDYSLGHLTVDTFQMRALFDIDDMDSAEPLADELVRQAAEKGFSDLIWQNEAFRGEILLKEKRDEEAEIAFRRAQTAIANVSGSLATDHSKRRFGGVGKEDITYRLVQRDIQKADWNQLFKDLENGRARAFADMLARQRINGKGEDQAVSEIRELDKQIRRQRLLNAAPGGAGSEGIQAEKRLLDSRRQKLDALKGRNPEIAGVLSIFTEELSALQQKLGPGEVVAYALPSRSPEKIGFLIITSNSARIETSSLSQDELRDSLKLFQSFHPKEEAEAQKEAVSRLTQDLKLQSWGAKTLLYAIPSGEVYFVPWGALGISSPIVVLPNGSWLTRMPKSIASAKTASVIGDPETGGALPSLPGAREEAALVAQVYGVKPVLGEGATEEAVRSDIGSGVGVLHLATHGFFNDKNPLESAVILSTGQRPFRLTAARLFENPLPATLVVLSACETGLGKAIAGDDFLGLARSFYLGGTQALVYSLWPVSDSPTRLFMEEFHRNAVPGSYAKAWERARDLLKEKGYAPSEYGAFILGGHAKNR